VWRVKRKRPSSFRYLLKSLKINSLFALACLCRAKWDLDRTRSSIWESDIGPCCHLPSWTCFLYEHCGECCFWCHQPSARFHLVRVDLHKRMQWHLRLDDKFSFAFLVFSKAIDSSFDFDWIIPICAGDWLLLVGVRKGKTSSYPLLTKYICVWIFLEAIPKTGQDESKRYQVRSWLDGCDAKSYQRNAATWGTYIVSS
jgi:hypothetical protein